MKSSIEPRRTRPTFLVIGVAKGGTTSLHHYLRQHPDIYLPPVKELNHYSTPEVRRERAAPGTLAEYCAWFDAGAHQSARGEVSPQYINNPEAAESIRRDLPDVRLVISLRNPADRAWSDYLGRVRSDLERRSFQEATRPGERLLVHGFYAPRLAPFMALFPSRQVHVILHEEYTRDTQGTLRRLFEFLGVGTDVPLDTTRRHNPAEVPRWPSLNRWLWRGIRTAHAALPPTWRGSGRAEPLLRLTYRKPPVFDPSERQRLLDIYREDILETGALIGRDLGHWLER